MAGGGCGLDMRGGRQRWETGAGVDRGVVEGRRVGREVLEVACRSQLVYICMYMQTTQATLN